MKKNTLIFWMSLLVFCSVANAELVINGDGTVTDTETGLMWQQDESGYMNWESALSYCENLELAGYNDWRLPNINELQSLVDYSKFEPAIDKSFFPNAMSSYYWSSTTGSSYTGSAWDVDFSHGYVSYGYVDDGHSKSFSYYVRAVRSGQ
jgi:hypothetical protein